VERRKRKEERGKRKEVGEKEKSRKEGRKERGDRRKGPRFKKQERKKAFSIKEEGRRRKKPADCLNREKERKGKGQSTHNQSFLRKAFAPQPLGFRFKGSRVQFKLFTQSQWLL